MIPVNDSPTATHDLRRQHHNEVEEATERGGGHERENEPDDEGPPILKSEVPLQEQLRALVEEHGLRDVFHVLVRVCADKAKPVSASDYDKEIASRWGEALVLLSRIEPKLTVPF